MVKTTWKPQKQTVSFNMAHPYQKIKIDLFTSDNHRKLFNMMKDHLSNADQLEAFNLLMFMSDEQVIKVIADAKIGIGEAIYKNLIRS